MSRGKHGSELKCGASIGVRYSIQGNSVQLVDFPDAKPASHLNLDPE
jgi:hypothetical protein